MSSTFKGRALRSSSILLVIWCHLLRPMMYGIVKGAGSVPFCLAGGRMFPFSFTTVQFEILEKESEGTRTTGNPPLGRDDE